LWFVSKINFELKILSPETHLKFLILHPKFMKLHFFFNFSEDIPEQFYSSENHQLHKECSVCGSLLEDGIFFIEKAFRRTHDQSEFQLTFEYATCERCKNDMLKSISKESFQNIQRFAMEMGGMPVPEDAGETEIDMDYLLNHCIATGRPLEALNEYHLVGIFEGDKMIQLPMLYGESFIEEYAELLSEETKGFFDDFFNHITILPPALTKILEDEKPKRPVLF